jgi:hypothetical protein
MQSVKVYKCVYILPQNKFEEFFSSALCMGSREATVNANVTKLYGKFGSQISRGAKRRRFISLVMKLVGIHQTNIS